MGPGQACLTDAGPYALALHPYGTLTCSPGAERATAPLFKQPPIQSHLQTREQLSKLTGTCTEDTARLMVQE